MSNPNELTALANISLVMKMDNIPAKNKVEFALYKLQQIEPLSIPASIKLKDRVNTSVLNGTYDDAVARCNSSFDLIIKNEEGIGRELLGTMRNHLRFTQIVSQHAGGHNHTAAEACGIQLNPTEIINQAAKAKASAPTPAE